MNHVKHQDVPASLSHRQDSLGLNGLLTSPKVWYCEKCVFASTNTEDFENHVREHLTRFYCFYCNHVSYSKKELEAHLLQHKYPFRCQYCGQGYMRRAHLSNHIERLHSIDIELDNAQKTVQQTFSVSTAFAPGVHRTSLPTVKVRLPVPFSRNEHADDGRQRRKMVDVIKAPKASPTLMSPGQKHNKALTVPLPEEVSIPAGCRVELIGVKTVNGTKELKLRLLSQQENKSVLDDAVLQHSTSAQNHRRLLTLGQVEKSSIKSKKYMAKNINVEHPATIWDIVDKAPLNLPHGSVSGTKRTLQESIHNGKIHHVIPPKVPRVTEYPLRQGMAGIVTQTEMLKPQTDHHTAVITGRTASKISLATEKVVSFCRTPAVESCPAVKPSTIPPEIKLAVKQEPNDIGNKTTATQEIKADPLKQKNAITPPISSSVSTTAHASTTTLRLSECKKEEVAIDSTILVTMLKGPVGILLDPVSTKQTKMEEMSSLQKSSIWSDSGAGLNRRFEPFPVISSVFSLSQHQDDVKSSIEPLVKALRGIVMRKDSPSVQVSTDSTETTGAVTEHMLNTDNCIQGHKKMNAITDEESCDDVRSQPLEKCSQQTQTQAQKYYIKEETSSNKGKKPYQMNPISATKCESLTVQQEACINITPIHASVAAESDGQIKQSPSKIGDSSSKFLTVSLERIHIDLWRPSKKSRKLSKTKTASSIRGLCRKAFLYPAPLKLDQLVIRPGPNQPVVVLNHPEPTVPKRTDIDQLSEPQLSSEVLPRCQILKMRLSKVIGEKYEVIGCTVGVFS